MIIFTPKIKEEAGNISLSIGPERDAQGQPKKDPATGKPIPNLNQDTHCNTLLALLYWASYTFEGRKFVIDNALNNAASTANIRAKCAEFGITEERLILAILDAHIWALIWERENRKGAGADIEKKSYSELVYSDNINYIMSQLVTDFKGREFTLNW